MAILAGRFKQAEYVRNIWHASPAQGVKPDDLLKPEYWIHIRHLLKAGDRIEILCEAGEWYAEAIVLDAARYGAKIAWTLAPVVLQQVEMDEIPAEYIVMWSGPHTKWRVLRASDKAIVKENLETKAAGAAWIVSHLRAMAA